MAQLGRATVVVIWVWRMRRHDRNSKQRVVDLEAAVGFMLTSDDSRPLALWRPSVNNYCAEFWKMDVGEDLGDLRD